MDKEQVLKALKEKQINPIIKEIALSWEPLAWMSNDVKEHLIKNMSAEDIQAIDNQAKISSQSQKIMANAFRDILKKSNYLKKE